ncbi:MAG: hypothetical protein ACRCX2_38980 [Paraclostridium sp.]
MNKNEDTGIEFNNNVILMEVTGVTTKLVEFNRADIGDDVFKKISEEISNIEKDHKRLSKRSGVKYDNLDWTQAADLGDCGCFEFLNATNVKSTDHKNINNKFIPDRQYLVSGKELNKINILPRHLGIDPDLHSVILAKTIASVLPEISTYIEKYKDIRESRRKVLHTEIIEELGDPFDVDSATFDKQLEEACEKAFKEYNSRYIK